MSTQKELWFFAKGSYKKGLEWYSKHFDECTDEKEIGESTPAYMGSKKAVKRIASNLPEANLIFLLRDPVDRLHSEYWYRIQRGKISPDVSFHGFVQRNPDALGIGAIELGYYYRHLRRYENFFGREQMCVLLFREMVRKQDTTLRRVFNFLGVEEDVELEALGNRNPTKHPKSVTAYALTKKMWKPIRSALSASIIEKTKSLRGSVKSIFFSPKTERPEMSPEVRSYLADVYAEPNRKLADWLGRDLSHWT